MRRILLGLFLIAGASAAIATGATGAFFSDTETSTGNTFAAGAIDLKVDNDSYYNGNRCTNIGDEENPNFVWQGSAPFPVPNTPCTTSFPLSDLDSGLLFFNFTDLKPDDEGEDTISLHVQNDAYACMDLTLTSNDDNSSNEPELASPDAQEDINNTWDGELAQNLQFFWWADDGDNVYEEGEETISGGVKTLINLAPQNGVFSVALADSQNNVWTGNAGPMPAHTTQYIGKAWCFGTMALDPVAAGAGQNPSINPGVTCDGTALNNLTQTDGATVDVAFRAVQARHNASFVCNDNEPATATITVIKLITNDNGGNNVTGNFQLFVDNGVQTTNVTSNVPTNVSAGAYTVGETGVPGYVASFSGDCDSSGAVALSSGDNKTCTITNNDQEAHITLVKNVVNDNDGTATPGSAWGLRIDGNVVPNNSSVTVNSNAAHTINEDGRAGYHFVSITGNAKCPAVLGGTATLDEGESITCTITNDDDGGLSENFGTGSCLTDIPGWDEDAGESCVNGTVAAAIGTGDNTASPDGGRFGLLSGNNGFLCRQVNATGLTNLVLKYYWRGDSGADAGETGSVKYFTGGTCAAPTGVVTLVSHPLTTFAAWSPLETINLPALLDNTTFFIRFTADSNNGNESFRVDGITITGS